MGPTELIQEEDEETLAAAIDRVGSVPPTQGRTVALDEVRKMIPVWVSIFESSEPALAGLVYPHPWSAHSSTEGARRKRLLHSEKSGALQDMWR